MFLSALCLLRKLCAVRLMTVNACLKWFRGLRHCYSGAINTAWMEHSGVFSSTASCYKL